MIKLKGPDLVLNNQQEQRGQIQNKPDKMHGEMAKKYDEILKVAICT